MSTDGTDGAARPLAPRPGFRGLMDRIFGPGAGRIEQLRGGIAALGGALLAALTVEAPLPATLTLMLLTAHVTGGIAVSLNSAGKAWQHRPPRRLLRLCAGAGLHLVHLLLFVWLFRDGDAQRFVVAAIFLLGGTLAVLVAPATMQRGIGLLTVVIAMIAIDRTSGLVREAAWFLPLLYTRVLVAWLPGPMPSPPERETPP